MKSKKSSVILNKQEARKLLDKWLVLRDFRIQNQMNVYNHSLPHSAVVRVYYSKFLMDLINNDLDNATKKLEDLQGWSEDWLKDEWLCLGRIYQMESIFSKNEWNLIQSTFQANVDDILDNLNDLKEHSDETHQTALEDILKFITSFKTGDKTIYEIFKEDIKKFTNLVEECMNEMGELAAKSLHGKICLGIARHGELKGKKGNKKKKRKKGQDLKDAKPILQDLWKGLKEEDAEKCLKLARKLKDSGEKNAIHHARFISDLQHKRKNLSDESKKLESLIEENKLTTEMRRNGLYYSMGLYFQNALELSLAGFEKIARREYTKAEKLSFESKDETSEVTIKDLLDDPDAYDGKIVKVSGLVANINETKHKSGKGEVVFITFELHHDDNSIEFYFPRNWLTDNGLEKQCLAEFTGTFNKKCNNSNKPDIHVIRQGLGKRKNDDWVSRCKWLVNEWWDGFTGRATANWTLGTLTPDLFEGKPPSETSIDNLRELRKNYPAIRAGLRPFRSLISNRIKRKLDFDYAKFVYSLYMKYTLIDSIFYLTLMSILKEKISLDLPSARAYFTESPWTEVGALKTIAMCKIERQEFKTGDGLEWLKYEIDTFPKELKKAK